MVYKQLTMTIEEMNAYLKSIDGLKSGQHITEKQINDCCFFECEDGWLGLIKELISDLVSLGWDRKVLQIKQKFGGLRFYIMNGNELINKRIKEAELKSYTICEITGKPGKLRGDLPWIQTLCEEEYEKKKLTIHEYEKQNRHARNS